MVLVEALALALLVPVAHRGRRCAYSSTVDDDEEPKPPRKSAPDREPMTRGNARPAPIHHHYLMPDNNAEGLPTWTPMSDPAIDLS